MSDIFGKLEELGMEIISVANVDAKGRIVIPKKIRNDKIKKYTLHSFEDMIILKEAEGGI